MLLKKQLAHQVGCDGRVQDETIETERDSEDLTVCRAGSGAFTIGVRSKTIDKRCNGKSEY